MPATPRRAGRKPQEGTRFASDVIADNIRAHRVVYRLSQEELAARMRTVGFDQWTQATVSEIERYSRAISVEELMAAALALEVTPVDLLDPHGLGARPPFDIIVGLTAMSGRLAQEWVHDRTRVVPMWFDKKYKKVERVETLACIPRPEYVDQVNKAIQENEQRRKEQDR